MDDLLLFGPDQQDINQVKEALSKRFKMTDQGPCVYYLGMTVTRDRVRRTFWLGQQVYIEKILQEFDLASCNPTDTLMDEKGLERTPADWHAPAEVIHAFMRMVGSLMYVMIGTRPNLAFAVSATSRHSANPTVGHLKAAKRIFRYLRGTSHFCLTFQGELRPLSGYTDADWAQDRDIRRFIMGYIFNLGSVSISWVSKRQATTALSSYETKYQG